MICERMYKFALVDIPESLSLDATGPEGNRFGENSSICLDEDIFTDDWMSL